MSRISPGLGHMYPFHNKVSFYNEELLAPRSTPSLEDHPLSAVRDCLFSVFSATLHTGGCSSICVPEDVLCHGDRDPLICMNIILYKDILSFLSFLSAWVSATYISVCFPKTLNKHFKIISKFWSWFSLQPV